MTSRAIRLGFLGLGLLGLLGCSSEPEAAGPGAGTTTGTGGAGGEGGGGCDEGYVESVDGCVDVDECATDNGGCGDPEVFLCENLPGGPPACHFDPTHDHTALTKGVSLLDAQGGLPSPLVVFGETAFPVVLDEGHHAFVAAAREGQGKVLVYGHETYMNDGLYADADADQLLKNAVSWMSPKESPTIGIEPGLASLESFLTEQGFTVKTLSPADLSGIDVYCTTAYNDHPDAEYDALRAFVEAGGGLVVGGQGWYWSYTHSDPVHQYPGNRMLSGAGVVITTSYGFGELDTVTAEPLSDLFHAKKALDLFLGHVTGEAPLPFEDLDLGADTVDLAIDFLPLDVVDYFDAAKVVAASIGPVVPTAAAPLTPADHPIERTVVHLDAKIAAEAPPAELTAHPAAADFPGAVQADAPVVSRTLTVDGTYAGRDPRYAFSGALEPVWRSTGVYAPPGKLLHVKVDAAAAGQGLDVLIGSHTDGLWALDAWPRFPALTRAYPIAEAELDVASAFGGLVYVRVPPGAALGPVSVTIDGGVAAPRFVAGQTSLAEWQSSERDAPGPWAEIGSDKLILIVPSSEIRTLDDPSAVTTFWDQVADADADLASISHTRVRAERFATDREISAGYMHSGYPIMTHLDFAAEAVDAAKLQTSGSWGPFHELGHNHQWLPWVLPGSTEASVNLWSVYVFENVLGISRDVAHPSLAPAERAQRIQDYVAGGADFYASWNVWTSLETYLQLQEGFGWAPFQAVFAAYTAQDPALDPQGDAAAIDMFCTRFAAEVNADLGPFFLAWGFPLSQVALDQMALLPPWANNPM